MYTNHSFFTSDTTRSTLDRQSDSTSQYSRTCIPTHPLPFRHVYVEPTWNREAGAGQTRHPVGAAPPSKRAPSSRRCSKPSTNIDHPRRLRPMERRASRELHLQIHGAPSRLFRRVSIWEVRLHHRRKQK